MTAPRPLEPADCLHQLEQATFQARERRREQMALMDEVSRLCEVVDTLREENLSLSQREADTTGRLLLSQSRVRELEARSPLPSPIPFRLATGSGLRDAPTPSSFPGQDSFLHGRMPEGSVSFGLGPGGSPSFLGRTPTAPSRPYVIPPPPEAPLTPTYREAQRPEDLVHLRRDLDRQSLTLSQLALELANLSIAVVAGGQESSPAHDYDAPLHREDTPARRRRVNKNGRKAPPKERFKTPAKGELHPSPKRGTCQPPGSSRGCRAYAADLADFFMTHPEDRRWAEERLPHPHHPGSY